MLHKRNAARNHQRGRNGSVGSALEPVGVTEFYRVLPGFFSLSHFDLESRGFYRVSSPPPPFFPSFLCRLFLVGSKEKEEDEEGKEEEEEEKEEGKEEEETPAAGSLSAQYQSLMNIFLMGVVNKDPAQERSEKKTKKMNIKEKPRVTNKTTKKTPKPAGTRSALPSFVTGFPTNPHPLPCERYQSIMIVVTVQNGG